jgi:GTP-binding protein
VKALLNHAQMLFKQSRARAGTGELNRMLRDALRASPPPPQANRTPKIFYATQVGVQPPTIVLFCSAPSAISRTYQRYLLGKFRDELDFPEVPIKLYLRRRHPADLRDEVDGQLSAKESEPTRARKSGGSRKKEKRRADARR